MLIASKGFQVLKVVDLNKVAILLVLNADFVHAIRMAISCGL